MIYYRGFVEGGRFMINVNQQALLELLKASLFGAEPHFPEGVDWDAVLQEAKDQTVVALAAPAVPEEEAEKWRIPVIRNKMRFFQIFDEQTYLVNLFQDADIPMVILKGCAAAMYYPEPLQRTMGDIDFIVPIDKMDEANRLMTENGYAYLLKTRRHYDYNKNCISLELHFRYSEDNWDIEESIIDGMSHIEMSRIYGQQFPTLPAEINGLVLIDHIRSHLYSGLGLRQIIDWMMFVHAFSDDKMWMDRFVPIVRKEGLENLAVTVTKMCKLWLGLSEDIKWCDNADEETVHQLMKMIFDSGNFGRKEQNEDHSVQGFVLEASRYGVFRYLQITGEATWKAYQKHIFLRPFAWLYQSFRFARRGLSAMFRGDKKKLDTSSAIEKRRLLEKLDIVYSPSSKEKEHKTTNH